MLEWPRWSWIASRAHLHGSASSHTCGAGRGSGWTGGDRPRGAQATIALPEVRDPERASCRCGEQQGVGRGIHPFEVRAELPDEEVGEPRLAHAVGLGPPEHEVTSPVLPLDHPEAWSRLPLTWMETQVRPVSGFSARARPVRPRRSSLGSLRYSPSLTCCHTVGGVHPVAELQRIDDRRPLARGCLGAAQDRVNESTANERVVRGESPDIINQEGSSGRSWRLASKPGNRRPFRTFPGDSPRGPPCEDVQRPRARPPLGVVVRVLQRPDAGHRIERGHRGV